MSTTNYDFLLPKTYIIFTGQNEKLVKDVMSKYEKNETFDDLYSEDDIVKFVYVPISNEVLHFTVYHIIVVHDTKDDFDVFEKSISKLLVWNIILCNVRIINHTIENCKSIKRVRDNGGFVYLSKNDSMFCHLEFADGEEDDYDYDY